MADTKPTERHEEIQFRQLLDEAVTKPGTRNTHAGVFPVLELLTRQSDSRVNTGGPTRHCSRADCLIQSLERTRATCEARRKGD